MGLASRLVRSGYVWLGFKKKNLFYFILLCQTNLNMISVFRGVYAGLTFSDSAVDAKNVLLTFFHG